MLVRITVRNAGPEAATIDVLPTLWFRNTWSWGTTGATPSIRLENGALVAEHDELGTRVLSAAARRRRCSARTRRTASGSGACRERTAYPKDGIGDHVVHGAATVNPEQTGTKAAFRYRLEVARRRDGDDRAAARRDRRARRRLRRDHARPRAEADEFYGELTPAGASRRRGARAAPGARGDALVEAVLPLRRAALARGRPGRPAAAGVARWRAATTSGRT